MLRKWVAVLALAAVVLVAASCGSSGGSGDDGGTTPGASGNQWNSMVWNQGSWGP